MILRWTLGILISGAWLVSMGLLLRMHYFPEESRLAQAEPKWVMERFLSYGSESALDIWKGNEIIGLLRLESRPAFPVEKKQYGSNYHLITRAELEMEFPGLGSKEVLLKIDADMTTAGDVVASKLELGLVDMGLNLEINQEREAEPVVRVKEASGRVVMDMATLKASSSDMNAGVMKLVAGAFGIRTLDVKAGSKELEQKTTHEARRGAFTIFETGYRGYILKTNLGGGDKQFTLHLGEGGEVLQMKTSFLDYRFINTDLRPDGAVAHKKNNSLKTK
jgi:hypothetical protein